MDLRVEGRRRVEDDLDVRWSLPGDEKEDWEMCRVGVEVSEEGGWYGMKAGGAPAIVRGRGCSIYITCERLL